MGKLIFIIGGARSGKSTYAVRLAKKLDRKVAFIATCLPLDAQMKKRIELHKKKRPAHWRTFEKARNLSSLLRKIDSKFNVVIIDCITLLISNMISDGLEDRIIKGRVAEILKVLKAAKYDTIIVSNEVGLGIVPANHLARRFRDLAGRINQILAKKADDVFFMAAGLPLRIKGKSE